MKKDKTIEELQRLVWGLVGVAALAFAIYSVIVVYLLVTR